MASGATFTWQTKRTDISYRATFSAPQFGLLTTAARSFYALHSRLGKFGLRLADIRAEGNATTPSDFAIVCSFPTVGAILKLKLETIEFSVYSAAGDSNLQAIISEAIEAVKEIAAPLYKPILVHQVTLEFHGALTQTGLHDYLLRFVSTVPWEESRREGVNVAFNIGADSATGRLSAAVVVAKSSVLSDALYVQITAGYDGALALNDFVARYFAFVVDSLARLELAEQPK